MHRPEFTGNAGEYFGIWFVNMLLSILTLGIYSAWAKVRTERYFYGHTRLVGASFEYLATPIQILKGRLIAYAVVIALTVSGYFSEVVYYIILIPILLLTPALIAWGLRFRARNSAWRGIGFHFDRSAGSAYVPHMLWVFLTMISVSLVYPVMKQRQHAFLVEGHRYGTERFAHDADMGQYYIPYATIVLALLLLIAVVIGLSFATTRLASDSAPEIDPSLGGGLLFLATSVGFFTIGTYLRTWYTNLMWNGTSLGQHQFRSTLRVHHMLWLYASNIVAIVCTVGLAVPWAMIRLARYRAANFELHVAGSIDDFVADQERQHSARSAELVDALDLGGGIGL